MNEIKHRSTAYYRLIAWAGRAWIYALLMGGSIVFVWPFLWMATTSAKVDREMFGEAIRLWPRQPTPQIRSPYIDEKHFADVTGPRMDEALPVIEQHIRSLSFPWPDELDADVAIRHVSRGAYKKLVNTMPVALWDRSLDKLSDEIRQRVDTGMVADTLMQVRRHYSFGQLRVRSYDLQENQLVSPETAATAWNVTGTATARLVQVTDDREPYADLHYDFSNGDTIELSQTFTTSFPVSRLHRIQLYTRHDDSWHDVTLYVEKHGKRYRAVRANPLADFNWNAATWQEPGPDDDSNKIKNWILLEDVDGGPQYERDPRKLKITLEIKRAGLIGAWQSKIARNYRGALNYIPFWRYVATSVFLVIINLVGTLFSCSLVAYAFARLQWPGRGLCFALMLATMMIPPQVTMIPHFLIMRSLGWYNTLVPLFIGSFFASAFNVFLLRQFLKGIPRDLEDAAKIDGCGFWRVYWHIMLPLVKPTLAAIAIFTFMGAWNDFMGPLIYLSDQRLYPLSLGLYAFNVQAGGSMGMMMAGSLLMTVPVIVIFFFAQKYFIQGVTLTGMKG
jgi:multiple sugar transport system permease protein